MTHTPTPTVHRISPLTDLQLKQLMNDLRGDRIATRKQGGSNLSYLETWDVKATLIRVFGFGGFSAEADLCDVVKIENNVPKTKGYGKDKVELPIEFTPDGQIKFGTANFRVTARVRVKLTIHQLGAVYTEWAASSQTGPDLGEVTDFAIKTAESDALKRAAIYLGTQFGLSLYNDGATQDVVKAVLAPEQAWNRGTRVDPVTFKPLGAPEQPAERPASAGESVAHLRPEGVSDEEHQRNMAHLNNALSAQIAKKQEREAGPDTPLYRDPTLDPVYLDSDAYNDGQDAIEAEAMAAQAAN